MPRNAKCSTSFSVSTEPLHSHRQRQDVCLRQGSRHQPARGVQEEQRGESDSDGRVASCLSNFNLIEQVAWGWMNFCVVCAIVRRFIFCILQRTLVKWPTDQRGNFPSFNQSFPVSHHPRTNPLLKKSFLLHKIAHVVVSQMYFCKYGSHRSWGIVLLSSFEMRCAIRLRSVETSFGWRSPNPQKRRWPLPLRPYGTPENAENADQVAQSNAVRLRIEQAS